MYYQLPNGKVIQLSVEEYLSLTFKDIQYLISINAGEHIGNPWSGSIIHDSSDKTEYEEDETDSEETEECYFDDFFSEEDDIPDEPFDFELDR